MKTAIAVLTAWCLMAVPYYQQMQVIKELNQNHSEELAQYTNLTLTVTAYTACAKECDGDPSNTAIMRKPIPGKTVAVSRDRAYLLGKKVWIEGIGVLTVNDLMNKRYTNRIDILVSDKKVAQAWGIQERKVISI